MDIIRIERKKDLEESLDLPVIKPNNTIYVNVSDIIDSDIIPKKYHLFKYQILIPTPNLFNIHIANGFSDRYLDLYLKYLRTPEVDFFINEMILTMLLYQKNLILFCSSDEKEFKYLKILGEYIKSTYFISMISYKKFIRGERSKIKEDIGDLIYLCEQKRKAIINLLDKLDIRLPKKLNQRIPKDLF